MLPIINVRGVLFYTKKGPSLSTMAPRRLCGLFYLYKVGWILEEGVMPTVIKTELEWLKSHAEQDKQGIWKCRKTDKGILTAVVGRSIWLRPFMGGSGEVRRVTHLACDGCNPDKISPDHGAPIYEDELTTI
jgi:hypothetical protein